MENNRKQKLNAMEMDLFRRYLEILRRVGNEEQWVGCCREKERKEDLKRRNNEDNE